MKLKFEMIISNTVKKKRSVYHLIKKPCLCKLLTKNTLHSLFLSLSNTKSMIKVVLDFDDISLTFRQHCTFESSTDMVSDDFVR